MFISLVKKYPTLFNEKYVVLLHDNVRPQRARKTLEQSWSVLVHLTLHQLIIAFFLSLQNTLMGKNMSKESQIQKSKKLYWNLWNFTQFGLEHCLKLNLVRSVAWYSIWFRALPDAQLESKGCLMLNWDWRAAWCSIGIEGLPDAQFVSKGCLMLNWYRRVAWCSIGIERSLQIIAKILNKM